jgi:hypothetical protein
MYIYMYITRVASNEIFSKSNKINRKVVRAKDLSASLYIPTDCCKQRDRVPVIFSVLPHGTFTVQILYKLYSLQLNCTYSNYTEAAAKCSSAQQHRNFPAIF